MARAKDSLGRQSPSKLTTYRAKRDPKKTPEPMGGDGDKSGAKKRSQLPTFVIQEHHARALHWDFRLERDGVLVSWALPKGLPIDPKTNHLAVHTEDHPLDYGEFEGDIPKGEYGGGHVTHLGPRHLRDSRSGATTRSWSCCTAKRASGRYVLFPTDEQELDDPSHGPGARRLRTHARTRQADAGDGGRAAEDRTRAGRTSSSGTACARCVYVDGGRVRALTRNDKDLADDLSRAARDRTASSDRARRSSTARSWPSTKDNRPSFSTLSHSVCTSRRRPRSRSCRTSIAGELLRLRSPLPRRPLHHRAHLRRAPRLLEALKLQGETFATPPSITNATGAEVLAIARERGLEGIVIKRRELALRTRVAQRRLDQGEELPHPRGRDRRMDRGQGRTRRQPRRAAARHPGRGRTRLRRQGRHWLHRRDASRVAASACGRSLARRRPFSSPLQSRRDVARTLRSSDHRRRGPVRRVDGRRPSPSSVMARTAIRQERERGRP